MGKSANQSNDLEFISNNKSVMQKSKLSRIECRNHEFLAKQLKYNTPVDKLTASEKMHVHNNSTNKSLEKLVFHMSLEKFWKKSKYLKAECRYYEFINRKNLVGANETKIAISTTQSIASAGGKNQSQLLDEVCNKNSFLNSLEEDVDERTIGWLGLKDNTSVEKSIISKELDQHNNSTNRSLKKLVFHISLEKFWDKSKYLKAECHYYEFINKKNLVGANESNIAISKTKPIAGAGEKNQTQILDEVCNKNSLINSLEEDVDERTIGWLGLKDNTSVEKSIISKELDQHNNSTNRSLKKLVFHISLEKFWEKSKYLKAECRYYEFINKKNLVGANESNIALSKTQSIASAGGKNQTQQLDEVCNKNSFLNSLEEDVDERTIGWLGLKDNTSVEKSIISNERNNSLNRSLEKLVFHISLEKFWDKSKYLKAECRYYEFINKKNLVGANESNIALSKTQSIASAGGKNQTQLLDEVCNKNSFLNSLEEDVDERTICWLGLKDNTSVEKSIISKELDQHNNSTNRSLEKLVFHISLEKFWEKSKYLKAECHYYEFINKKNLVGANESNIALSKTQPIVSAGEKNQTQLLDEVCNKNSLINSLEEDVDERTIGWLGLKDNTSVEKSIISNERNNSLNRSLEKLVFHISLEKFWDKSKYLKAECRYYEFINKKNLVGANESNIALSKTQSIASAGGKNQTQLLDEVCNKNSLINSLEEDVDERTICWLGLKDNTSVEKSIISNERNNSLNRSLEKLVFHISLEKFWDKSKYLKAECRYYEFINKKNLVGANESNIALSKTQSIASAGGKNQTQQLDEVCNKNSFLNSLEEDVDERTIGWLGLKDNTSVEKSIISNERNNSLNRSLEKLVFHISLEKFWDKSKYLKAECRYYEFINKKNLVGANESNIALSKTQSIASAGGKNQTQQLDKVCNKNSLINSLEEDVDERTICWLGLKDNTLVEKSIISNERNNSINRSLEKLVFHISLEKFWEKSKYLKAECRYYEFINKKNLVGANESNIALSKTQSIASAGGKNQTQQLDEVCNKNSFLNSLEEDVDERTIGWFGLKDNTSVEKSIISNERNNSTNRSLEKLVFHISLEKFWDKSKYLKAECRYYEFINKKNLDGENELNIAINKTKPIVSAGEKNQTQLLDEVCSKNSLINSLEEDVDERTICWLVFELINNKYMSERSNLSRAECRYHEVLTNRNFETLIFQKSNVPRRQQCLNRRYYKCLAKKIEKSKHHGRSSTLNIKSAKLKQRFNIRRKFDKCQQSVWHYDSARNFKELRQQLYNVSLRKYIRFTKG